MVEVHFKQPVSFPRTLEVGCGVFMTNFAACRARRTAMNQVLGELSDGGVSVVKGSNELVISC